MRRARPRGHAGRVRAPEAQTLLLHGHPSARGSGVPRRHKSGVQLTHASKTAPARAQAWRGASPERQRGRPAGGSRDRSVNSHGRPLPRRWPAPCSGIECALSRLHLASLQRAFNVSRAIQVIVLNWQSVRGNASGGRHSVKQYQGSTMVSGVIRVSDGTPTPP